MEFAAACLSFDAKNYHSWAHRQAIISAFGGSLWAEELEYTAELLEADVRNNSAWNQRAFVMTKAPLDVNPLLGSAEERYQREHLYIAEKLKLAQHNESAWAYLAGLATWPGAPKAALAVDRQFESVCIEILQVYESCVPALNLLVDIFIQRRDVLRAHGRHVEAEKARDVANGLLSKLIVADPVKREYYKYKLASL